MHDVIVIGGGAIGLSIAREVAARGGTVLVLDRGMAGEPSSWAAAGMLAPQSEAEHPDPLFHLCVASLHMYRAWADHLREQTGIDPEYADPGLLFLAATEHALEALKSRLAWQRSAGFSAELLAPEDLYRLEPGITLPVVGAALMPGEHHITPRRLLKALRSACTARGVEIRSGIRVQELMVAQNRVEGVRAGNETISGRTVIVSSGAWSGEIAGLRPRLPVSPRKGQILSLSMPGAAFRRMIRWENAYFVPRRDGELVVGATNEDAGFDRNLTPSAVGRLLTQAQQISSHTGAYPIIEMWTGLRPATPDGLPVIGRGSIEGLIYATGHYRNGILLAPVTASIVASLVENQMPAIPLEPFAPSRFEV